MPERYQGRIQDLRLEGGVNRIKEHFVGKICEKSRFYAKKKLFFFQLQEGAYIWHARPWIRISPVICVCVQEFLFLVYMINILASPSE